MYGDQQHNYVDPPLNVIKTPRPPQRILLAPKNVKTKSASDVPVYETEPPVESQWQTSAVLKAVAPYRPTLLTSLSQPKASLEEQKKNAKKSLIRGYVPAGSNWVSNLINKSFAEAMPVLQFHHMPYRIVQIDGVTMNMAQKINRAEILLIIVTSEGFSFSMGSESTADDKSRDQLRVSSWFSQNNDKAMISSAKISQ